MSRMSEEATLKAYPKQMRKTIYGGDTCIDDDLYKARRQAFREGYEQAEEDLMKLKEKFDRILNGEPK